MRPDRLIVGEVRGGEALDMLQALNTGHDGSLSTIHANGPAAALARLETLTLFAGVALPVSAVRSQIAAAIDAVVHVGRSADGGRVVLAVAEVAPDGRAVRVVLARENGQLVPKAEPARPARRPGVDIVAGVARVTTIAIALFGTGVSAWLARGARRFAVIDRVRRSESARLPRGVRIRLARMLDAAAIDHSPEQVVQLWLLSAFVVGVVGVALGMAIGCGAVITVVGGGPIALHTMRHRRARAVTAAVPETLERVAAELRAGGTGGERDRMARGRRWQPHRRLRARAISGRARRPDTCRARRRGPRNGPRRAPVRRRVPSPSRTTSAAGRPTRSTAWPRPCATGSRSSRRRTRSRPRRATPRSSSGSGRSRTSDSRSSWTGGRPMRCSAPRPAGRARSPASRSSSWARGGCGASSPRERRRDPRGRVRLGDRRRRRRARLAPTHRDHPPHARDGERAARARCPARSPVSSRHPVSP